MAASERIVITGASRGLGLEFCRQWVRAGKDVAALARDPDGAAELRELAAESDGRISLHACDVTDAESVRRAAGEVADRFDAVDVLVNNAGVSGRVGDELTELDFDDLRRTVEINALGPLRVTQAFLAQLLKGRGKLIVHLTSLMGSIADNESGGWYGYRMSKAALNMASRNLALALRDDGVASIVLHPGWVRTDMGGGTAPLSAEAAVRAMVKTIDRARLEDSGKFFDRDGGELPW